MHEVSFMSSAVAEVAGEGLDVSGLEASISKGQSLKEDSIGPAGFRTHSLGDNKVGCVRTKNPARSRPTLPIPSLAHCLSPLGSPKGKKIAGG